MSQQEGDTNALLAVCEAALYLQMSPSMIAMKAFCLDVLGGEARIHGGVIIMLSKLLYSLVSFFFLLVKV